MSSLPTFSCTTQASSVTSCIVHKNAARIDLPGCGGWKKCPQHGQRHPAVMPHSVNHRWQYQNMKNCVLIMVVSQCRTKNTQAKLYSNNRFLSPMVVPIRFSTKNRWYWCHYKFPNREFHANITEPVFGTEGWYLFAFYWQIMGSGGIINGLHFYKQIIGFWERSIQGFWERSIKGESQRGKK